MGAINLTETLIGREVERLFSKNPARSGDQCRNPVTGAGYVRGADPIGPQKKAAYRALLRPRMVCPQRSGGRAAASCLVSRAREP